MFKEFRKFILRGNVVDLAVGFVVGAAFTTVIKSLVDYVVNPLVAIFYGGNKIGDLSYTVSDKKIGYGMVISSLITFLIVAAVVFFLVVKPVNHLNERLSKSKKSDEPSMRKCPECLSEIPKEAIRCKFCTAKIDKA